MATFLFQGNYTSAAIAAMVRKHEDRSIVVRALVEQVGGKLEGFWLALGEYDFVGIAQLPDAQSAAALGLAATAGGGVHGFKTTPLLTWTEAIKSFKKAAGVKYRPPTK